MANLPDDNLATRRFDAWRFDAQSASPTQESVIDELPVALSYNGISHAVMMATPQDLEDFAVGFSLSEGIVDALAEIRDIELSRSAAGISLSLQISERRMAALRERRRTLTGRTGCGLCGAESLEQAIRPVARVTNEIAVARNAIHASFAQMAALQHLNRATGAAHAAALVIEGACLVREDVGRHNALDKLIGAMQRRGGSPQGFALITSRASYEMIHKAASANIPLLAAISAPTSLAIDVAREAGVTLIGFARGESMTCYAEGRGKLIE